MQISWQQLNHLPVQTQSGQKIGVVRGVSVDVDSHTVTHYEVIPGIMLLGLFSKPFLVAVDQVVSIKTDVMIVKDAVEGSKVRTGSEKTRLAYATPKADVEMSEKS